MYETYANNFYCASRYTTIYLPNPLIHWLSRAVLNACKEDDIPASVVSVLVLS